MVAPKINPIFNIIKYLHIGIIKNSDKSGNKSTEKGSEKFGIDGNDSRTLNSLNNMLVTPCEIGSYEHHLSVLRNGKIPLVVLLSSTSNISISSTSDEISNSTSYFVNDLYDSMVEIISLAELHKLL